eukprot:6098418-Prymnesium_polylepis.1
MSSCGIAFSGGFSPRWVLGSFSRLRVRASVSISCGAIVCDAAAFSRTASCTSSHSICPARPLCSAKLAPSWKI